MKTLLIYYNSGENATLSYNDDWANALNEFSELELTHHNLANYPTWPLIAKIRSFELILLLHSTNTNGSVIPSWLLTALKWRKAKLGIFIGNEYKLMAEKFELINSLQAETVISQLPDDVASWLYSGCTRSKVISLPHALNPKCFRPINPISDRLIDIGLRAFRYPWYLGDIERLQLFEFFDKNPLTASLKKDISFDPETRFTGDEWNSFLNNCRGTISTEAGSSYLEKDDRTRLAVNQYTIENPNATFSEVYELFFRNYSHPQSGKCISSRHFDAIGAKTCQIMFPGRFNDILKADQNYISLNNDFSNAKEVLEKFRDDEFVTEMNDRTYEYVLAEHTHRHRIIKLLKSVFS